MPIFVTALSVTVSASVLTQAPVATHTVHTDTRRAHARSVLVDLVARAELCTRRRPLHSLVVSLGVPPVSRAHTLRVDVAADLARRRAAAAAETLDKVAALIDVLLLCVQRGTAILDVHDAPVRHAHDGAQEFEPLELGDLVLTHLGHALREEALTGVRALLAIANQPAPVGTDHEVEPTA